MPSLGLAPYGGAPSNSEGLGDNTHGENAHIVRHFCHDRSRTGTGTAAHTGSDEYHVGALECRGDLVTVLLGSTLALFGNTARTLTTGELYADMDLLGSQRALERLIIGIDGDEFRTLHAFADHAVHCVSAAAADTHDLDIGFFLEVIVVDVEIHLHNARNPFLYFSNILRPRPETVLPESPESSTDFQGAFDNTPNLVYQKTALFATVFIPNIVDVP